MLGRMRRKLETPEERVCDAASARVGGQAMLRFGWIALCFAACAAPVDMYIGSDIPLAVVSREADAGESTPPQTPPSVSDSAPDASAPDASAPDASDRMPAPDSGPPPPLPTPCAAFVVDCDGDAANGCEADLRTDRAHCGACEVACQSDDCMCRDGKRVVQCRPGRADCDGLPANGCEVDLQTDVSNCGGCARACHTMGHDAITATCNAGLCELTCRDHAYPQLDCDHDPDNGCETQIWTDTQNCGMCGRRCFNCELGTCMI
jgi:hypothetical protein